ncbi:uncharacterized protein LOC112348211 [Selaginella moellendorffii]|uniref:uncharacterized protein LOC112348211 n=1 Tax=Selaginella moellendorffii TaxID=88036 RepID=UPI000D1C9CD5|nr:uncharacterized protein LOC112348211 [Selaginella moellendorffii]|eukprot:XP_024536112.1 uncharacterized protein LOC112348211 [Selaginella moellendorffii]
MARRLSAGVFEAASKAVSKLTERAPDPEEDPDFLARNPRWEDQLPPIHGVGKPQDDKAQSTAALLAALENLPRAPESLPRKNWKKAYKAVKRILLIRRKARRSAVGTGARMEGHALGFWSPYSSVRLNLFMFLHCQYVTARVFLLVVAYTVGDGFEDLLSGALPEKPLLPSESV